MLYVIKNNYSFIMNICNSVHNNVRYLEIISIFRSKIEQIKKLYKKILIFFEKILYKCESLWYNY